MGNLPQYKQMYETLRGQIASGEFRPGDLLPSEHDLCRQYRLARPTVRKALDQLVADGFIVKHQGKGSIVKGAPKGIGILSLTGTTSALSSANLSTHIILKPESRPLDEAFSFPVEPQEQRAGCFYFERLRLVNGEPVFFDITIAVRFAANALSDRRDRRNAAAFRDPRRQAAAGVPERARRPSDPAVEPEDRD